MSTEQLPPGPPDATSGPSVGQPTATNNPPDESNSRPGANYFFGFLVTFIVLLLIFIGCGFGTRRRMARRRAMFAGEAGPWVGMGSNVAQKEPVFWEPHLVKGGDMWSSIMVSFHGAPIQQPPTYDLSPP
jgi:hypothetical protein